MTALFKWHRYGVALLLALFTMHLLVIVPVSAQGTDKLRGGAYAIKTFYISKPEILKNLPDLLRKGKHDRALKSVNELISTIETDSMAPYAYHAYAALCVTETAREDHPSALKACNKAISYRPGYWEALNNRGALYYVSGNIDGARADFEAASLTTPNSEAAELITRNLAAVSTN